MQFIHFISKLHSFINILTIFFVYINNVFQIQCWKSCIIEIIRVEKWSWDVQSVVASRSAGIQSHSFGNWFVRSTMTIRTHAIEKKLYATALADIITITIKNGIYILLWMNFSIKDQPIPWVLSNFDHLSFFWFCFFSFSAFIFNR